MTDQNVKWDYFEQFMQGINLNQPQYKNIDVLSILFAKNKNSLLIGHSGMAVGGIGLQIHEALQLSFYTGIMIGYLLYTGNHTDVEMLTDKILKRLFEHSKIFGYNKAGSCDKVAGITIKPVRN